MNKQINTTANNSATRTKSLRPRSFNEYIGQEHNKRTLMVAIKSAKIRKKPLDHVLLFGPPGLGKTTMASVISNEMSSNLKTITGPMIERPGDIASVLCSINPNDILFIDEIHRMNKAAEEVLYSAMEDYCVNIVTGQGEQSRQIKIDIPPFTLIGATTRAGMLSAPLRDRFGIQCELQYYNEEELSEIALKSAERQGLKISENDCLTIASVSRGTPRIVNQIVARIRDYAYCNNKGIVTPKIVQDALSSIGIHKFGLTSVHIRILNKLSNSNRPVGLNTLSTFIGETSETIEEIYEPYLIRLNLIDKTPSGRVITEEGRSILASI